MLNIAVILTIIYLLFHPTEVVPGLGNRSVARGQAGNPFVFKDPTYSAGQAIGAGLFDPAHDQQHTLTSGINPQVGLHLGGPFSSNTWQHILLPNQFLEVAHIFNLQLHAI